MAASIINPNKIIDLPEELYKEIRNTFIGNNETYVQIGPKKYIESDYYRKFNNELYNFEVTPKDIWVITMPRSGTTLTQELVWQIMNLDFQTNIKLIERFSFLEICAMVDKESVKEILKEHENDPEMCDEIKRVFTPLWEKPKNFSGNRFIKSHLPISLLPPELLTSGCKLIYVARNPKDMMVSRFHFYKMSANRRTDSFDAVWNLFEKNLIPLCPYWEHIFEAWNVRHKENVLFLFYEDIVLNQKATIEKVSKFLGKTLSTNDIDKLMNHLKVENFKNNDTIKDDFFKYKREKDTELVFVRKGKVNSYQELFTDELNESANKWIQKHYETTDLRFPYMK